jgi:DNA-binding transcriptional LysR family regulator
MRYSFDDIAAFLQVVETGSISAAARRLSLSKSVVSQRITNLEAALGAELFHRSTRRVVPTDKGHAFYERAGAILRALDEAAEEISERGELCGQLRITTPMSFGTMYLGPILFPFLVRHPRLELALELDDRMLDLLGEGYDLGIRIGRLRDSSLVARRIAVSRRLVCCSPEYARRAGLPETIEALARHACIGYANVPASQLWQFEPRTPAGELCSTVVRSRIVVNNGEAMRDAAIAGLGLAVVPIFIIAQALKRGELIDALPGVRPVADMIYALYPQTRNLSRKVRAVIDHLVDALGGEPPWERELN